jgi:hypothetical protein
MRSILQLAALVLLGAAGAAAQVGAPAPAELVRLAFEADERSQALAQQYAYRERVKQIRLGKDGAVKGTDSKTYDVAHLCGRNYRRLILRDGQSLSASDRSKEQRKLDKCIAKIQNESPSERDKRLAKEQEELEDLRKMRREVIRAFEFTVDGEEVVAGEPAWRIRAEPKADYEPEFKKAAFLSKLAGTIWISKSDYGWVKTEVETIAPARFGLFLLTLKEGSQMEFTQTKLNNELWMLDHVRLRFDARVLIAGVRREVLIDWSDFKKFSAESRLVAEEPQ